MSEPQIEERVAQPYVRIVREVTAGVPAAVDAAFPQLFGWLAQRGVEPAGPPLIRYRELDPAGEPLLLEVGVPVADGVAGEGEVEADVLPGGRYATLLHVGPYRSDSEPDLLAAEQAFAAWTKQQELDVGRPSDRGTALHCYVEHYRVGPVEDPDWSRWETELAYLVV